jgi:POT family proton-dependent oligopeptide transporter
MIKNHPKGLLGAALSNMGERFGFYIMMAILSLFLMAKFGLGKTEASIIYSVFYALIYILALVGGRIADKTKKYKGTIFVGLIMMAIGYLMIAVPTPTPVPNLALYLTITCLGLLVIAFGNGLFKGNLQAVVGQMYDKPEYSKKRDVGFQLFYMFINVGALFAPLFAVGIRNWWVEHNGFLYNSDLPALCHGFLKGTNTAEAMERFSVLASDVSIAAPVTDLTTFANSYLDIFNTGFHYAFGVAIVAMLISMTIFIFNKKKFPTPADKKMVASSSEIQMSVQEIKQRFYALFAVFSVVIFFWFSFHQNGMTLTFFAKEYTDLSWLSFQLGPVKFAGAEIFQFFNPFFVVFLTPIVIGFFGWLRARGKEPSTPRKIAIGMGIATIAFIVMLLGSMGLPSVQEAEAMGGLNNAMRVTPFLLIGTYFILTIAELFISPLGLSFVSKVAPPQHQGIMQGCWLGATAIGNQLLFIGAIFYTSFHPAVAWGVFIAACLISMFTMLAMVKWLERVAK